MTFSYELLDQLSDQYGMDIDEMLAILGDPDDDGNWTCDDENKDGIPDVLAGLITDPIITNPSQGGAWG